MNLERSYFKEPTLTFAIIVTAIFALGCLLSFMAMTDLFTQSPFQPQNRVLLFTQVAAFLVTANVIWNYLKIRNKPH